MADRKTTETIKVTPEVKDRIDAVNRDGETIGGTIKAALESLEREKDRMETMPAWTYGRMDNAPIIEVDELQPGPEQAIAVIDPCPLCGDRHKHGFRETPAISTDHSAPVHKVGHCHNNRRPDNYWLIVTSDTENAEKNDNGDWVVGE